MHRTACFAATGDEHVDRIREGLGLELGERSDDGSVSLAETVCLGFCHASPAVRDGDVIDAGPGVVDRVLAGECAQAAEPEWRSVLDEPVLTRPGDWSGLRRALEELTPEELLEEVKEADVRGRGGAGFPAGQKWAFARAAEGDEKFIVANGDEGDPGSYIDKYLMERSPELLLEGMALAGYAVGAAHGFVLTRSEYPLSKPALEAAASRGSRGGLAGHGHRRHRLRLRRDGDRGRGLLRRRRGDGAARLPAGAARHGLGPPAVPGPARPLRAADRGQQRRDALQHALRRGVAEPPRTVRSAPGRRPAPSSICFNERFASPGVYEVPFGIPVAELCEELAGGLRDGRAIKALQIGGPLGGILPASLLDTPFDFDPLVKRGLHARTRGDPRLRRPDRHARSRPPPAAFRRRTRAAASAFRAGSVSPVRTTMFVADQPVDRDRLEDLLEALEVGSLCAHGGGMPAPIRSLLKHYPEELRLA